MLRSFASSVDCPRGFVSDWHFVGRRCGFCVVFDWFCLVSFAGLL